MYVTNSFEVSLLNLEGCGGLGNPLFIFCKGSYKKKICVTCVVFKIVFIVAILRPMLILFNTF